MTTRDANPVRGEVPLTVGDRTYVLRMSTNAICALQARTGKTYGELVSDLSRVDYASIRELLFTFLQPRHAKDFSTLDSVGDLMDDIGGHNGLLPTLRELFVANMPPKEERMAAPEGRPRPAQAGTGAVSG